MGDARAEDLRENPCVKDYDGGGDSIRPATATSQPRYTKCTACWCDRSLTVAAKGGLGHWCGYVIGPFAGLK
jgi:hypothetical protein